MSNIFTDMTKEQAIEYCYKNRNKYIAECYKNDVDGIESFECLISCLESGHAKPSELPDYGMDFEKEEQK